MYETSLSFTTSKNALNEEVDSAIISSGLQNTSPHAIFELLIVPYLKSTLLVAWKEFWTLSYGLQGLAWWVILHFPSNLSLLIDLQDVPTFFPHFSGLIEVPLLELGGTVKGSKKTTGNTKYKKCTKKSWKRFLIFYSSRELLFYVQIRTFSSLELRPFKVSDLVEYFPIALYLL